MGRAMLTLSILCLVGCASWEAQVRKAGFYPVTAPSSRGFGDVVGGIPKFLRFNSIGKELPVCTTENFFGDAQPTPGKAPDRVVEKLQRGAFDLKGSYLREIAVNAGLHANAVRRMTVDFRNVSTLSFDEAAIDEANRKHSIPCARALTCASSRKPRVLASALVADVTYAVTLDVGGGGSAEVKAMESLSAFLTGSVANSTNNLITGKQIVWGVLPAFASPVPNLERRTIELNHKVMQSQLPDSTTRESSFEVLFDELPTDVDIKIVNEIHNPNQILSDTPPPGQEDKYWGRIRALPGSAERYLKIQGVMHPPGHRGGVESVDLRIVVEVTPKPRPCGNDSSL